MNEIKSEKSLTFINDRLDNVTDMLSPTAILELKMCMIEAAAIAETEAEERHAKELQKLIDAHDVDKYHLENNHQIELQMLKDKAIEQHKQHCSNSRCPSFGNWRGQACSGNCEFMKSFITELNK